MSRIGVITNTNSIDGIVYASCGVCNFGLKESYECFLAIKVGDTVFPVEGSDIDDHGDAHAEEGLCNVIHHAEVSGEFKNNVPDGKGVRTQTDKKLTGIFKLEAGEFSAIVSANGGRDNAFTSYDYTAYYQDRMNLNPLSHLDPLGTLALYFLGFGWAKPVPVSMRNLSNPRKDMMLIAIAGPASNIFLATIGSILLRFSAVAPFNIPELLNSAMIFFVFINIVLVFNLIQ